jgi:putative transposase
MTTTYKFRMYPNKPVREKLDFALDICRQTYNNLLEEMNNQVKINRGEIQHKIVTLKETRPELKEVYSKTLQYECYRLFSNLSALRELKKHGKKVGRLRFKGRDWFKTISYNQSGFSLETIKNKKGILHLSKIGDINIKVHRKVEGKIKQITIKKSLGKWYAMIVTDFMQKRICGNKEIGIDLGINNYIMDSEGNSIAHPKTIDKYAEELKTAQQDLSRKKKGSHNRSKARFRVAKVHEKIERVRNDFLHKLSNQYVKDCKLIVVENLAIKDMMQSSYNAKNIADASWNRFVQFLCYKAESAGCKVEKINPKNTTKQCSNCGNLQKMPLWIRTYKCSSCGFEIDRDLNSAINIKSKFIGSERANVENNSSVQIEQELSMKQEAITSTGVRL